MDDKALKAYEVLLARVMRADARNEALFLFVSVLASRQGIDTQTVVSMISDFERSALQKMLERAENQDPRTAAILDTILRGEYESPNQSHS